MAGIRFSRKDSGNLLQAEQNRMTPYLFSSLQKVGRAFFLFAASAGLAICGCNDPKRDARLVLPDPAQFRSVTPGKTPAKARMPVAVHFTGRRES